LIGVKLVSIRLASDDAGVGDVEELYAALSRPLERIVRAGLRAPDSVIEDACQFAWSRLVLHRHRVRREAALAWLAQTALREAYKLLRRADRECSLDAALAQTDGGWPSAAWRSPDELLAYREQLELIRRLPERQQKLVWLRGLGLSYREMATHTGCTTRTVERQLLRAKKALRGALAD